MEAVLYSCVPKNKTLSNTIPDFENVKNNVVEAFVKALDSDVPNLSRSAWKTLLILRKISTNQKLATEIFQIFNSKNMLNIEKGENLHYISEFLLI